jgi:hypothetical protein
MLCPSCGGELSPSDKFCRACGAPATSLSQAPTAEAESPAAPAAAAIAAPVGRLISSDSLPVGGFTPGMVLADRYRVIGLIGRGGMGEVYRADDLKLGQPVALKFLPKTLANDPVRRERLFAEVRIARQVSHPNICRVYDISELEGRHFLTMEFIDGEDLASLLKRIGSLHGAKALDVARQLCAGLAAAHDKGVLHRDLKPANVMIDGRGRVRITDFGLAVAAGEEMPETDVSGTPPYMAPEQFAGKGASVRSDIYALGLVFYEIFTGKRAFESKTLAELRSKKETSTPTAPSEIARDIDPVVERVILRCIEKDPRQRPASAEQVAAALPGGDPLAAAIAAGETPSPEMVAASGSKEGLRPGVAWGLLAYIIISIVALMAMNHRVMLQQRIPFQKPPEVLIEQSRELIKKLGYSGEFADSAHGFKVNDDYLRYIETTDNTANRWKKLDAKAILFWYRQSPRSLGTFALRYGTVSDENPPMQFPGEVLVELDAEGRLFSLQAVPDEMLSPGKVATPPWAILFTQAGLDISHAQPTDTRWRPLFDADSKAAWQGSFPIWPGKPIRIEAAESNGKPVSFRIKGPWSRETQTETIQLAARERISLIGGALIFIPAIFGGIFFARRNMRLGRGDRRNATRLALFVLGLSILAWILNVPHESFNGLLLWPPYFAALFWIFYMALEPFVRRRWPHMLVSWTRLVSGDWRDKLVARDILIGCAITAVVRCIIRLTHYVLPSWLGHVELSPPQVFSLDSIAGTRFFFSAFTSDLLIVIGFSLGLLCLLFMMTVLLRNQYAAIAGCVLVFVLVNAPDNLWSLAIHLALAPIFFIVLMRFGLVAVIFNLISNMIFQDFPTLLNPSAWYSGYGYLSIFILLAMVLYAFRTSLGGRPLLAPSRLDE